MLIKNTRPSWAISRRTLLRGGLGTAMCLPFLDAMSWSARAQAGATDAPRRFLAFYVPNGMHMPAFVPGAVGALGALPSILSPLESVKQHVTVVSGLQNAAAFNGSDGSGDHARGTGTFLTCTRLLKSDVTIRNGISVDQVMAQHLRQNNFAGLSSLELGCEAGGSVGTCDSGYSCAYAVNVSWAGVSQPQPKETNPRAVFDRLFAGVEPAATTAAQTRRALYRQSVLDVVKGDAARLHAKLGAGDRQKLDAHLTGVRELERRLQQEAADAPSACVVGADPGGVPQGDPTAYVRAMLDLVVNAFACDRTRVATFMLGNAGSQRNYSFLGVNGAHHEVSHHQNDANKQAQLTTIDRWEVAQLAYVIDKLARTDDGDGQSVLDNSTVILGSEIEDGNTHAHTNLPVLVAGHGGGAIAGGQHLRAQGRSMADLFLTALQTINPASTSFADSSGALALG